MNQEGGFTLTLPFLLYSYFLYAHTPWPTFIVNRSIPLMKSQHEKYAVLWKILFKSIALPLQILSEKWIVNPPALLKIKKDLRSDAAPNLRSI